MKKVILGVAIAATVGLVGCADQEWQKIYTDGDLKTFIKADSVKVENPEENLRSAWFKALYPDGEFLVYKTVVNCNTQEYYNKSGAAYNKSGQEYKTFPDETVWQQGMPGTNIMVAVNKVCK